MCSPVPEEKSTIEELKVEPLMMQNNRPALRTLYVSMPVIDEAEPKIVNYQHQNVPFLPEQTQMHDYLFRDVITKEEMFKREAEHKKDSSEEDSKSHEKQKSASDESKSNSTSSSEEQIKKVVTTEQATNDTVVVKRQVEEDSKTNSEDSSEEDEKRRHKRAAYLM